MRRLVLSLVALAGVVTAGATQAPQQPASRPATVTRVTKVPSLVVLLVVDQFRADYVQLYGGHWTTGLGRLINQGAYFPFAAYPYGYTVTCLGHTTIGSGQYPYLTGIAGNTWYDRETKKSVTCTDDPSVTSVPFGGGAGTE